MIDKNFDTPVSAKEALVKTNGAWSVSTAPTYVYTTDGHEESGRCVIYRTEDNVDGINPENILGHCSPQYTPMQNIDFASRIDSLFDSGSAKIVRAGSTGDGRRPFMVADCGESSIGGNDPIGNYILFGTSHDGSSSMKATPLSTRKFCTNSLTALFARSVISIPHRKNMQVKLQEAKDALTGLTLWHNEFEKIASTMASKTISDVEFHEWVNRIYIAKANRSTKKLLINQPHEIDASDLDKQERAHRKREKFVDSVGYIWANCDEEETLPETGISAYMEPEHRGTSWHALNSVTHYVDHMANFSDKSKLTGRGASIKYEAFSDLMVK
jgi:phage/plasmid-like protein (TIGR03299 family)